MVVAKSTDWGVVAGEGEEEGGNETRDRYQLWDDSLMKSSRSPTIIPSHTTTPARHLSIEA